MVQWRSKKFHGGGGLLFRMEDIKGFVGGTPIIEDDLDSVERADFHNFFALNILPRVVIYNRSAFKGVVTALYKIIFIDCTNQRVFMESTLTYIHGMTPPSMVQISSDHFLIRVEHSHLMLS